MSGNDFEDEGFHKRFHNMSAAEKERFLEVAQILVEFSQKPFTFQPNNLIDDNNHVKNHTNCIGSNCITIPATTSGTSATDTSSDEGCSSPRTNTGRICLPDSRPNSGKASYTPPVLHPSSQASNQVDEESPDEQEDEESDKNVSSHIEDRKSIKVDVEGKKPQPTYKSRDPSAASMAYAVLAKATGGEMSLSEITQGIKDSYPSIKLKEQTVRAALSRATPGGGYVFAHKNSMWRILGANEEKTEFGSGGCKKKNDNSSGRTRKGADESSKTPRKRQKSATPMGVMLDAPPFKRM